MKTRTIVVSLMNIEKAAAQIDAASEVLPLDKIGEAIARALTRDAQAVQRRRP